MEKKLVNILAFRIFSLINLLQIVKINLNILKIIALNFQVY